MGSMGETELLLLFLAERERVLAVVVFGMEEEEEERRERLAEREGVVDEDEGAAEEASARFRLRVSIQNPPNPIIINSLATERQSQRYHGSIESLWC